jgi:predicted transcriptional regulator
MSDIIKLDKWCDVLINADKNSISDIMRKTQMTYSHTYKLASLLKERRLINIEKIGRKNYCRTTINGNLIIEHLLRIKELMNI